MDGDDDKDVLISGAVSTTLRNCTLYINDGKGNFSASSQNSFPGITSGNIIVNDVDGDNDQDVFFSGVSDGNPSYIGALYLNDGKGVFKEKDFFLPGAYQASAFCDVDGDCDQDLLLLTRIGWNQGLKLFLNDGFGEFALLEDFNFENSIINKLKVFDLDGDSDQDILLSKSYFIGNSII